MDLETFVAETLRQIVKGVTTAQRHADCQAAQIPAYEGLNDFGHVEFDVAVTVTEANETAGKGCIGISILGVGGKLAATRANSSVNRVRFSVPVSLPTRYAAVPRDAISGS